MQRKEMELEGTLRAFSLPDILQFLSMGKMTGILSIWREGYSIDLTIREGKVVNSSSLDRPRKLGQMLVYRGFIRRHDLNEVLNAQQGVDRGKLLGQILIERELISKKTLREALKLQLEEEIWELFSWKDGQFKFEHRMDIDISNILVEIDIEPLLIEGSRRLDEWGKIVLNITGDNVILAVQDYSSLPENNLSLSENEWQILSYVNGFFDVGAIIDRSGLGKFETYRILNIFLSAGLLKVKPAQQVDDQFFRDQVASAGITSLKNVRPQEAVTTPDAPGASRGIRKGLSSFFTKTKPVKENASIQMDFVTPLGAMAFFVNSFFETLISTDAFIVSEESDCRLLGELWKDLIMRYPRADIIGLSAGRINVKTLEAIVQWNNEISKLIRDCFEESLSALSQLNLHLFKIARERLGDKNAEKIASDILMDFGASIRLRHDDKFEFRSWMQDLLKI